MNSKRRGRHCRSDYHSGFLHGRLWRKKCRSAANYLAAAEAVQISWFRQAAKLMRHGRSWPKFLRRGKRYASGFLQGAGIRGRLVPIPLRRTFAAIIHAPGSVRLLRSIIRQLRALPLSEILVVLHEPAVRFFAAARSAPGVTVAYFPGVSDPDIGRALGAKLSTADSVLFVDGGKPVKAETLAKFLWLCGPRLDVVLNDVTSRLGPFRKRRNIYRLAEFLNRTMERRDLGANSLATLPYALSRKALNLIGPSTLAIPPKAQTSAIFGKLRLGTGPSIKPSHLASIQHAVRWQKTAQAHAEAWRSAIKNRGGRLFFPDRVRNRSVLRDLR